MGFFIVDELTRSSKADSLGIDNTPDKESLSNIQHTITQLDKVRAYLNQPMLISSGYRCPTLNKAVGGAKDSFHLKGCAVDFTSPKYGTTTQIVQALIKSDIEYDKLILEYPNKDRTWVHIQFNPSGANRRINLITTDGTYHEYKY